MRILAQVFVTQNVEGSSARSGLDCRKEVAIKGYNEYAPSY